MEKKIADFVRFFGEKSDFDGAEKDFGMKKSEVNKSEKNRRFFFDKNRFFLEKKIYDFFPVSKNMKKLLLTGFEPKMPGSGTLQQPSH